MQQNPGMGAAMNLDQIASVEIIDGAVAIVGEIDLLSAPALKRSIDGMDIELAWFDLSSVTFIDSTGLQLFLELRHVLGPLRIVAASAAVERVLDLTGTRSFLFGSPASESHGGRGHVAARAGRTQ
jgi:anti-anti-sigma factor